MVDLSAVYLVASTGLRAAFEVLAADLGCDLLSSFAFAVTSARHLRRKDSNSEFESSMVQLEARRDSCSSRERETEKIARSLVNRAVAKLK